MKYACELAVGSYTQRGILWDRDGFPGLSAGVPLWRSMFMFRPDELRTYLDEHGTLRGDYDGEVFVDDIPLDLDGEHAIQDAQKVISLLLDRYVPPNGFAIYSSGRKGLHIHLARGLFSRHLRLDDVRSTVEEHFGHLESLDLGLYHRSALIRMPNSPHEVTGHLVREIAPDVLIGGTLTTIENVQEYAQQHPYGSESIGGSPLHADRAVFGTSRTKLNRTKEPRRVNTGLTNRIVCMQRLIREEPPQGHRHELVLRLASWMRRLGLPSDAVETTLQTWSHFRDEKDTAQAVASVFTKQLEYSCHDHIMDEYCSDSCIFYKHKKGMKPEVHSFQDQYKNLVEFRKKVAEGKGINLKAIKPFDELLRNDYWILPGEVGIFTGDTGMGKSAMVQNIVYQAKRKTLYLNLENAEELMTRRFMQIAGGGLTKEQINHRLEKEGLLFQLNGLSHIYQVATAPNLDEMEDLIKDTDPQIVVVDTTDVIEVPEAGNNEMWQLKRIIEMMRKIAARYDIIVLPIHHINKKSAEENRVNLNSLTGNRSNVTRMDHVFALTGPRDLPHRTFRVLKSRDSDPFRIDMQFHGARMVFTAPTEEEEPI